MIKALSTLLIILLLPVYYSWGEEPDNISGRDISTLNTFGNVGKELTVLKKDSETILLYHKGKGALTHMWFGGDFKGYEFTRIKIYVDGEAVPSIDMELFMGHGIGFGDNYAPWTTTRIGKTGVPSGIYNTLRIPFGTEIKVTAQLSPDADDNPAFWWIVRGTENLPVNIGGVQLPENARLKLYKIEKQIFEPFEEFDMCNVSGDGALYMVTMAAESLRHTEKLSEQWKDWSYLEACVRAYIGGSSEPLLLSSGLEDYFFGTYYFNKGKYYNDVAGITHLDNEKHAFSGYRIHDDDPVFFHNGCRLTNKIGEKMDRRVFHDPPRTLYSTYVWLYQW